LDQFEAFSYLANRAPDVARRLLDAVEKVLDAIAQKPESGHRYLNAQRTDDDWRYWRLKGFEKYFVFYRITDTRIEVVRIIHGSRDIDALLGVL